MDETTEKKTDGWQHKKPRSERHHESKRRNCLMCQGQFLSTWPGERVCGNCKSTTAWREGIAA